jgi:hypothetical protein
MTKKQEAYQKLGYAVNRYRTVLRQGPTIYRSKKDFDDSLQYECFFVLQAAVEYIETPDHE